MDSHLKTRSQRRMEKRQAVTVLVLVLVVAFAAFILGVMVGKRGAPRGEEVATEVISTPEIQVAETAEEPPATEETPDQEESLSFYDRLPQGEAPLGSGINLPPEKAAEQTVETVVEEKVAATPSPAAAPAAPAPIKTPEPVKEPAKVATAAPAKKPAAAAPTPAKPGGGYAVQVASLKTKEAATGLEKKLVAKGYPAFTVEAEVKKQRYFRVMVGPYDKAAAYAADKQLRSQEKIQGFVKRI